MLLSPFFLLKTILIPTHFRQVGLTSIFHRQIHSIALLMSSILYIRFDPLQKRMQQRPFDTNTYSAAGFTACDGQPTLTAPSLLPTSFHLASGKMVSWQRARKLPLLDAAGAKYDSIRA